MCLFEIICTDEWLSAWNCYEWKCLWGIRLLRWIWRQHVWADWIHEEAAQEALRRSNRKSPRFNNRGTSQDVFIQICSARVCDVRGMSSWGKYDVKYSLTLSYSTRPVIPSNPSSMQYHIMSAWTFLWNPLHVPQHKQSMHMGVFSSAMVKHNMLVVMVISIWNVFVNRKTSSNLLWTHFVYKSDSVSSNDWTAFWSFKSISHQIEVYETWLVLNYFFKYIHFYDPCYFLSSVDFVVNLMTEFFSHSEFGWDISF